jgi:hypothetical protein
MNRDIFAKFYAISSLLAGIAGDYAEEFIMLDNEKMRGYSISLVNEIDELLEQGKTREEIVTIIKENDFVAKDPELTKDEGEYLRSYSLKLLDIRYQLFVEEKDKHFTDVDDDYVVIDDEEPESRKLIKP